MGPWLILIIPASLIFGAIAALSHKRSLLGDICLAVPIVLSLPEVIMKLKEGQFGDASVIVISAAFLAILLIRLAAAERPVRGVTLLAAIILIGILATAIFPIAWFLIWGRF